MISFERAYSVSEEGALVAWVVPCRRAAVTAFTSLFVEPLAHCTVLPIIIILILIIVSSSSSSN